MPGAKARPHCAGAALRISSGAWITRRTTPLGAPATRRGADAGKSVPRPFWRPPALSGPRAVRARTIAPAVCAACGLSRGTQSTVRRGPPPLPRGVVCWPPHRDRRSYRANAAFVFACPFRRGCAALGSACLWCPALVPTFCFRFLVAFVVRAHSQLTRRSRGARAQPAPGYDLHLASLSSLQRVRDEFPLARATVLLRRRCTPRPFRC